MLLKSSKIFPGDFDHEKSISDDAVGDEEDKAVLQPTQLCQSLVAAESPLTSSASKSPQSCWPQSLNEPLPPLLPADIDIRNEILMTGKLYIRIVTWNQEANATPTAAELSEHLLPRNTCHIVAVGAQECENSFARSILNPYKTKWEATMMEALGSSYKMIRSHALQTSHLAIFVHKSIIQFISELTSVAIATGIGNTLGNKGGIGISFAIGNSRVCFVNSHLSAHQNNVGRRTFEFAKISYDLAEAICDLNGYTGLSNVNKDDGDVANPLLSSFDLVFWFGDMNYRIQGTREVVDGLLENNMHGVLLNNDQLTMLMRFDKVYAGFTEGPLHFRPTYKFNDSSDDYDTSKKRRIPSWTDRIIFKDDADKVELLAYDSVANLRTSDHRPVYANFRVHVDVESRRSNNRDPFIRSESMSEVCVIL